MKKILITFLILLICRIAICQSITGVTGTITDQNSITISGSSFGSNAAVGTSSLQWLGDNIEAGTDGDVFSKTNWEGTPDDGNSRAPRYDDDGQVHSRTNSIFIPYSGTYYASHIRWDAGGTASPVFVSYWIYGDRLGGSWTPLTSFNQWKSFRISKSDSTADVDLQPGIVVSRYGHQNFPTDNNVDWGCYPWVCGGGTQDDNGLPPASGSGDYGYDHLATNDGWMPGGTNYRDKWVRVDIYIDQGTQGNFDGTFQYFITNPGVSIQEPNDMDDYVGNCLIKNTAANLRYVFISQYNNGPLNVYMDDVFIQVGTQARVEIGDASTWGACTHREIVVPTVWSGTSITATLQQGSFGGSDTVYLYIIDGSGNVSSGFEITFGAGGGGGGGISFSGANIILGSGIKFGN